MARPTGKGPQRTLLIAGDKAGNWQRWYKKNIPLADGLFDDHLRRPKGQ